MRKWSKWLLVGLVVVFGATTTAAVHSQSVEAQPDRRLVQVQGPQITRLVDAQAGTVCYVTQAGFMDCVNVGVDVARQIPINR